MYNLIVTPKKGSPISKCVNYKLLHIYIDIVNVQFVVDNLAINHKYFFIATILWIYIRDSYDVTFDPE